MRNLKRVLSLALALVMVLGMMVITTSAADFTDADEITYTEAVDVMAGLGLFQGDNGALKPQEVLTRQDAATLVARIMLGVKTADKLVATKQIFADVETNDWSAKYIEYCYNTGLIGGYTVNGELVFNPEGKLTGIAFAKLLLCAMGYDANAQGYGGSNWASAIAVDALDAKLTIDGVVISADLTREQAAQMILQALNGTMVEYRTSYDYATGAAVLVGPFDVEDKNDEKVTFAAEFFPNLEKVAGVINAVDGKGTTLGSTKVSATNVDWTDIGYQAYNWVLNGQKEYVKTKNSISDVIITGTSMGVNTDGAAYADMQNSKKSAFIAELDETYDLYYNGVMVGSMVYDLDKDGDYKYDNKGNVKTELVKEDGYDKFEAALGKVGAKVDFVDNDNQGMAEAVIVTEYTYTTVDKVVKRSTSGKISIDHYDFVSEADVDADDVVCADELAKGDHITYVVYDGTYYVTVLEAAEGEFEYITRDKLNNETVKVYTIDGADYIASELDDANVNYLKTSNLNDDVVYVVDEYGYLVYAGQPKAAADEYLFVLDNEDSHGIKDIAETEVVYADGTVGLIDVDATDFIPKGDDEVKDGALADAIYAYTEKDGVVELEPTDFVKLYVDEYETKDTKLYGKVWDDDENEYADDATSYSAKAMTIVDLREYLDGDAEEGTVYVGYKEIPDLEDAVIYYLAEAALGFLVEGDDPATSTSASFVVFDTTTNIVDETKAGTTYELVEGVLVGGELKTNYILSESMKTAIDTFGVGAYEFEDGKMTSYITFEQKKVEWTPEDYGTIIYKDKDITEDYEVVILNIAKGEVGDWDELVEPGEYWAYFDEDAEVLYIVGDDVAGKKIRATGSVDGVFDGYAYVSEEGKVTDRQNLTSANVKVVEDPDDLAAAVADMTEAGTLYLPAGTYTLETSLKPAYDIVIVGETGTILTPGYDWGTADNGNAGGDFILATGVYLNKNNSDITVKNVTFMGHDDDDAQCFWDAGVNIAGSGTLTMENCTIAGTISALYMSGKDAKLVMTGCDLSEGAQVQVDTIDVDNVTITDCVFAGGSSKTYIECNNLDEHNSDADLEDFVEDLVDNNDDLTEDNFTWNGMD